MDTIKSLAAEYVEWTTRSGYPNAGSADELLLEILSDISELSDRCRKKQDDAKWVRGFIERWDETQAREDDRDSKAFKAWRETRVWHSDLSAACEHFDISGPGYLYRGNWYIKLNVSDRQDLGRYMTYLSSPEFEAWGELEHVERRLWIYYTRDAQ